MKIVINTPLSIKLLIFALAMFTPPAFSDSMAIFTASQQFSSISAGKAKMLFKGKIKRLNNKKYSLVDWPAGSQIKEKFYLALMGQSEARINAIRAKLIFSGLGYPPKVMQENNIETLERFLRSTPNSIGYAPTSAISDEFNILFTLQTENNDEK